MEDYIIAIIVLGIAIIIAFILANRKQWRIDHGTGDDPIEHYTEKRDKLTEASAGIESDDEEDDEEEYTAPTFSITRLLSSVIGFFLTLVVGWQVLNTVGIAVCDGSMNVSMDTMTTNLLGTCTDGKLGGGVFFTILPIMVLVGFLFIMFNIFGVGSSDDEEPTPKPKPKKRGVAHYTHMRDKMSKPATKVVRRIKKPEVEDDDDDE